MKLYVVVRADLPPGSQAVQACHALRQFAAEHPEVDRKWFTDSNTLVLLSAADEDELRALCARADLEQASYAVFEEPDLGGSMTAITIGPEGRRLCRRLPLALGP